MIAVDAAYLAGLVDGDGSIFISRRNDRSGSLHGSYRLILSVTGCNTDLMKILAKRHNRSRITWMAGRRFASHISWEGPQVKVILQELLPYLVGKREQARLAMGFPSPGHRLSKDQSEVVHKEQEEMYQQMKSLNKKWSPGKTKKGEGARKA